MPEVISRKTTVMMSSDHGQIDVNPQKVFFLNKLKWLNSCLKRSPEGRIIEPYGLYRDVFLQIKEDKVDFAIKKLQKLDADIWLTKDSIKNGLFGINKPSKNFLERVGDVLILPRKNKMIWYKHTKDESVDLEGMHGGLTQEEMIIPLAVSNMHDLQKAL